MWKRLNKILHDKNDYHLDPALKNDVAISDDLLQSTIKWQKQLIPRKFWYFIKHDKMFFLRLLAKWSLWFTMGLFAISVIGIVILLIFNINIDFKKVERPELKNIPIYIPSTGDHTKDSLNIIFYKRNVKKDANYIIFYLKDPSKNYKKWKENLGKLESGNFSNPYEARREGSQYFGKYQMGESARAAIGLGKITWEKWKSNPELQEAAVRLWVDILYQDLKQYIKKYDGKFLNGWSITESGIIAMSHNVGPEPVKKWLDNGGFGEVPKDGSGRDATRFLILGNYDLEITK